MIGLLAPRSDKTQTKHKKQKESRAKATNRATKEPSDHRKWSPDIGTRLTGSTMLEKPSGCSSIKNSRSPEVYEHSNRARSGEV
ncbi:hypothetical protein SLEP1_g28210 [Rubroshorea leprosula]|uniref:Uncharacterized protein n=1 Tax=Rubroshorea leprosula TaxID=152421 RepID=A0AAV5K2N4_9ROSI|nr:hypothetical protein SLEP1_g28210 [Rubroshorea leprosula]